MHSQHPVPHAITTSLRGIFYRFHKAQYFVREPDRFYKNFIDTRGNFEAPARFAPAEAHCGFYFANTPQVAVAEALFYAGCDEWNAVTSSTPPEVLSWLKTKAKHRVFLAVTIEMNNLVDFTDWRNVDRFLRHGVTQWRGKQYEYEIQYLAKLLSEDEGGNVVTDNLGVDARETGHAGVIFPSVRSLMYAGSNPRGVSIRQHLDGIQHMLSAGNIMDLQWQGNEQLKQEWNAVVFSGTHLTRCISELQWLDADGASGTLENPFKDASDDAIEQARLRERADRGLDPVSAAKEGLLSAVEAEDEFYETSMFIRSDPGGQ